MQLENIMKEREKTNKLVSDDWFLDHDIYWVEEERQRQVILNPGRDVIWFKKSYPQKGEFTLTHKEYVNDLPRKMLGKIVGVSSSSQNGVLRAKPIGTFFELFESVSGWRTWVNPKEYVELNEQIRRKNKEISRFTKRNRFVPPDVKDQKRV